jgi:hypothetical protein
MGQNIKSKRDLEMISETLRDVFVKRHEHGLSTITVATDRGKYRLDGDGFYRVADSGSMGDAALPAGFHDRRIVEVRCDGESTVIRLDNETYISLGWMLDTRSGEGYFDLLFHGIDDIDAEFLEFFQQLEPCEERRTE